MTKDYSHEGVFTGTIDKVTFNSHPPAKLAPLFFSVPAAALAKTD